MQRCNSSAAPDLFLQHLFINQSFCPSPDEQLGDLYKVPPYIPILHSRPVCRLSPLLSGSASKPTASSLSTTRSWKRGADPRAPQQLRSVHPPHAIYRRAPGVAAPQSPAPTAQLPSPCMPSLSTPPPRLRRISPARASLPRPQATSRVRAPQCLAPPGQ
jgi:hypothetical protein